MGEQEIRQYFQSKGFKGKALDDMVVKALNKNKPIYTSEETDRTNIISSAEQKAKDAKFERYLKHRQNKGAYNLQYGMGIATGVARQLPLLGVATDVTDTIGITNDIGTGDSFLNNAPESSIYKYLSQGIQKTSETLNPIGKGYLPPGVKRGSLSTTPKYSNLANKAAKYTKWLGITDRLVDGVQLVDHISGYNPPKFEE